MKELEFISYITKRFKVKRPVVKGIGDDSAVLEYTKDRYMLFTCDMIIEGTHFDKNEAPFQIGWKAMAVNISDIAAMGGIPKYALVSAGIPRVKNTAFVTGIMKGIEALSKKFDILVIGGDTNSSREVVLNVTLIGEVEKRCLVTRCGAKCGDLIFVTGTLGEGLSRHINFLPRLKEARMLVENFKINSMIDLSDGLSMDLNRLAAASSAGAFVYKDRMPFSERTGTLKNAISAGEDFELLFTASQNESKKIMKYAGRKRNLPITFIGEITKKRGVFLADEKGKLHKLKPEGFNHFA